MTLLNSIIMAGWASFKNAQGQIWDTRELYETLATEESPKWLSAPCTIKEHTIIDCNGMILSEATTLLFPKGEGHDPDNAYHADSPYIYMVHKDQILHGIPIYDWIIPKGYKPYGAPGIYRKGNHTIGVGTAAYGYPADVADSLIVGLRHYRVLDLTDVADKIQKALGGLLDIQTAAN